jgi:outer membrane protein assembly factor BamA
MFVGGGPTTMRGWPLRYLGGYGMNFVSDYPLGVGEIMLVTNVEQRFPIISIFEGAVFTDIGNVWSYYDWDMGVVSFKPQNILKTIALDAGFGLRANVSIATIRLDVALPLFDPSYPLGEQWIGNHWKWSKIALNFGINYPF